MPAKFSERVIANTALILATSMWGLATVVIKATVEEVPPLTFLMLRFGIAAILLIPFAVYLLKRIKLNRDRYKKIFTASVFGHVFALILIFMGIERTTAIEASLIASFSPLFVTLLGFLILRESIQRHELEGTLIAFLGTLLIVFSPLLIAGSSQSFDAENIQALRTSILGNLLFLAGIALDGFYSIYTKKNLSHDKIVTPLVQIVFGFIFAGIVFIPLGLSEQIFSHNNSNLGQLRACTIDDIDRANYQAGLACDNKGCYECESCKRNTPVVYTKKADVLRYDCLLPTSKPTTKEVIIQNLKHYLTPPQVYGILYMSLLSGILAYIFYQFGLKRVEASEASIFYYLQPVIAVPAAVIFLREDLSLTFLIGAIIIAFGVYLAERRK